MINNYKNNAMIYHLPMDEISINTGNLLYQQAVEQFIKALANDPKLLLEKLEQLNKQIPQIIEPLM